MAQRIFPKLFVPEYGEGSWDESARVIYACVGGGSDTVVVLLSFHTVQAVGQGGHLDVKVI